MTFCMYMTSCTHVTSYTHMLTVDIYLVPILHKELLEHMTQIVTGHLRSNSER